MVRNQWDQLVPALERGNFDILLNGLELTADNRQRIAMTQPYFAYAQQIITRSNTAGLDRMDALKGKAVGVLPGSALWWTAAARRHRAGAGHGAARDAL
jgi:polar amino acid transport system substrate-binding protein